jgi:pimeloyl-ACP methyl ester carboxylesterase
VGFVRAHGLVIAYDRVGAGAPLVLAHGGAEDGRVWRPQLAALADEFTVVAWDEPGAGRSSDVPAGFALADYASCLAALIESLEVGPAYLAGLSWGGTVVLELYRQRPDLVTALILLDTYAGWKGSLPEEEVRARVAGLREMFTAPSPPVPAARAVPPPAPTESFATVPGLFAGAAPAEFVLLLEEMAAAVRPRSLQTTVLAMAETDQRDLLPEIGVPVLLIWGEQDERSPLTVARQFQDAIPDAELVVIPACGHSSNLEQPTAVNAAVRAFCRAHPRARS